MKKMIQVFILFHIFSNKIMLFPDRRKEVLSWPVGSRFKDNWNPFNQEGLIWKVLKYIKEHWVSDVT